MTILRIETAGPDGRARRICFDDATSRLTSAAAVKELGLEAGFAAGPAEVDATLSDS